MIETFINNNAETLLNIFIWIGLVMTVIGSTIVYKVAVSYK